jgi:hypothetical protein
VWWLGCYYLLYENAWCKLQKVHESVINTKYRRSIDSLKANQNPPANRRLYVPLGVKKWQNSVHFVSSHLIDLRLTLILFYSEQNVFQCHFVHRRTYMDWNGNETRTPRWEDGDSPPEHCLLCHLYARFINYYFSLRVSKKETCLHSWTRNVHAYLAFRCPSHSNVTNYLLLHGYKHGYIKVVTEVHNIKSSNRRCDLLLTYNI